MHIPAIVPPPLSPPSSHHHHHFHDHQHHQHHTTITIIFVIISNSNSNHIITTAIRRRRRLRCRHYIITSLSSLLIRLVTPSTLFGPRDIAIIDRGLHGGDQPCIKASLTLILPIACGSSTRQRGAPEHPASTHLRSAQRRLSHRRPNHPRSKLRHLGSSLYIVHGCVPRTRRAPTGGLALLPRTPRGSGPSPLHRIGRLQPFHE